MRHSHVPQVIGKKSVEFLIYTLAAVSMGFVWLKPKKERLAFGLLFGSFVLSMVLYLIGSWGALLSYWNV